MIWDGIGTLTIGTLTILKNFITHFSSHCSTLCSSGCSSRCSSRRAKFSMLLGLTMVLASCGGSSSGGGGGGSSSGPAPTVTMSASPATLVAGQSTTLSWTTTNASSAAINSNVGASPGGVPVPSGSASVTPSQNTTYTITVTGNGQQTTATATVAVSPMTSFDGINSAQAEGGTSEDDIDPNGAVGTKQFMEYVNTSYQGYDKVTQAPVWTSNGVSAPLPIATPWQSGAFSVPQCSKSYIQLDAVILFDRLASRWVIAAKTTAENHYYFCIAVSSTDDLTSPSFTWYDYFYSLDPYLNNGQYLPDWPKLGTWWNGYFAGLDTIDISVVNGVSQQTEVGVVACAFDRADMLLGYSQDQSGQPNVKPMQCFNDPDTAARTSNGIYLAHSLIPADVDGTTAPPSTRDELMVSIQNPQNPNAANGPTTSSTINLWDFHVDWTTPANSSFTLASSPATNTYTPGCYTAALAAQTICIPEPGLPQPIGGLKVDSVGDRLMPRFAYRNFGGSGYESFLISHTVQTNLGVGQDVQQTGIRWYELRGSGVPTIFQQGTITPDATFFRYLPSIAQDKSGNAAVGYSISNPVTNPGISLSFWNLNDGQPSELTILNGPGEEIPFNPATGAIINNGQWGSYATITVDPVDDCTFWYVNEYWPGNLTGEPGPWSTNISYFQLPTCQ